MAEGLILEDAVQRFTKLLLDTCVLIDEFNKATGRLQGINRPQRATSIVALWEFLHGTGGAALPRATRAARRDWLDEQGVVPLRFSHDCSISFQSLLGTDESPPSVADALLAAECLARRLPIVTSNWQDFVAVPGLRYVVW